jgi:hypothetical protein
LYGGLIENLPTGICFIGVAAYQPSEHMVPVFQGTDKLVQKYDGFNFFTSQCRIRIEMTFGMMHGKQWGILQWPLGCNMKNMIWMAQAIARQHNYCIEERLAESLSSFSTPDTEVPHYIPTIPHNEDGDPVQLEHAFTSNNNDGQSFLREWMATREFFGSSYSILVTTKPMVLQQQVQRSAASQRQVYCSTMCIYKACKLIYSMKCSLLISCCNTRVSLAPLIYYGSCL